MYYIGRKMQLTVFGESHGKGVGALITGLPPGHRINPAAIDREMAHRKPGAYGTPRKEPDPWEILSGIYRGHTTGMPLAIWVPNLDPRPDDYTDMPFRPGHADYTAHIKYRGAEDPRGGGHFSGRLTAPLVAAGAILKDILKPLGVTVTSNVAAVGGKSDPKEIQAALARAKAEKDSLGGIVDLCIAGVPAGIGGPRFRGLESGLSAAYFALGAVKGVSFGAGFDAANKKGSENNDPFRIKSGAVVTETNHAGGILGGIATGSDIVAHIAVKPTPTIGKEQNTVDRSGKEISFAATGRHDIAIVLRIPVALEAMSALVILDEIALVRGEL